MEHQETSARPPFFRRHSRKLLALLFWLALIGGYQLYAWHDGLSTSEAVHQLIDFMATSVVGAPIFVVLYTACPLILFPVGLLAVAAGVVFGPAEGIILTLVGTGVSSSFAYLLGRYFGKGLFGPEESGGKVEHYADRMRANGFEAVLMTRFFFLPFDLVNYLAGFLRIGWRPFILASMLGSLPGTVSFVLLGSSIGMNFAEGTPKLGPSSRPRGRRGSCVETTREAGQSPSGPLTAPVESGQRVCRPPLPPSTAGDRNQQV